MTKILSCRAVGADCDVVIRGENEEEVILKALRHAAEAHNITHVPEECVLQLKAAIRDEVN